MTRSPLSFTFSKVNNASSSATSHILFSRPFTSFAALLCTQLINSCCTEGPKMNTIIELWFHQWEQSIPWFYWPQYFWSRPGCHLGTLLAYVQLAITVKQSKSSWTHQIGCRALDWYLPCYVLHSPSILILQGYMHWRVLVPRWWIHILLCFFHS